MMMNHDFQRQNNQSDDDDEHQTPKFARLDDCKREVKLLT